MSAPRTAGARLPPGRVRSHAVCHHAAGHLQHAMRPLVALTLSAVNCGTIGFAWGNGRARRSPVAITARNERSTSSPVRRIFALGSVQVPARDDQMRQDRGVRKDRRDRKYAVPTFTNEWHPDQVRQRNNSTNSRSRNLIIDKCAECPMMRTPQTVTAAGKAGAAMEDRRFDQLVRALGEITDRRQALT